MVAWRRTVNDVRTDFYIDDTKYRFSIKEPFSNMHGIKVGTLTFSKFVGDTKQVEELYSFKFLHLWTAKEMIDCMLFLYNTYSRNNSQIKFEDYIINSLSLYGNDQSYIP